MESPLASHVLALARQEVERDRREALARGERRVGLAAEYATPTLLAAGPECPLLDRTVGERRVPSGGLMCGSLSGDVDGFNKKIKALKRRCRFGHA